MCIISDHICISTGCSTVHVYTYTFNYMYTYHIITLPFDVTFYLTCFSPGSCGFAFADSSPRSFGTGKGASSDVCLEPLCPLFWIEPLKSRYACQYCTQLIFKSMYCICLLLSVAVPRPQYNIRVPTNTIYLGGSLELQPTTHTTNDLRLALLSLSLCMYMYTYTYVHSIYSTVVS